jgi:hypothetical protein
MTQACGFILHLPFFLRHKDAWKGFGSIIGQTGLLIFFSLYLWADFIQVDFHFHILLDFKVVVSWQSSKGMELVPLDPK